MNKKEKFSISKRIMSFGHAFRGLREMAKTEHNFQIHIVAAIMAVLMGFILKISIYEWIALCIVIGFVLVCEILNSSIEKLSDFVSPLKHDAIKVIKDLSAASVLISAITALIIGFIIFLPKIFSLCSNF